jgi:hypothetical protein
LIQEVSDSPYTMYFHAKLRARERFGIELTDRDIAGIIARIERRSRDVVPLRHNSRSVFLRHFAVLHDDRWLPIIYNAERRHLITVLPRSELWEYQETLGRVKRGVVAERAAKGEAEREERDRGMRFEYVEGVVDDGRPVVGTVTGFVDLTRKVTA